MDRSESGSVHVDLSVQDHFFESESAPYPSPISDETWDNWFNCWLEELRPDLSPLHAYELCLRLTDDAEIQTLNAQYRQKDQPTDVLSFAALETDSPAPADLYSQQPVYLGDIVISIETALVQAQEEGHSLKQELAWLAVHGLLHLLGWDHPDDESLMCMLYKQEALLNAVDLSTHYLTKES